MKQVLALITATAMVLSSTGCVVSASQIAADGAAVSAALLSIAKIEAVVDPTLAANLTAAASDLQQVTANWNTSSDVAKLNTVATVVETALASIPQTALIAPLIPIAVAALDILLANTGATVAVVSAKVVIPAKSSAVIKHRLLRSPKGDFEATWNATAKSHPGLESAVIK